MATLNWADIVEVSHDDAKQSLLDQLAAIGFTATSWQEGSIPLACVELSAEVWYQVSKIAVFIKGMALNSTSTGETLTRFSASHYNNTRIGATNAQRRVTLTCAATAGPHTFGVGEVVLEHADGPTYRNVADGATVYPVTLPSGGTVVGLVFEAEVAGSDASGKAANSVTGMVTTLAGVTVTSDQPERDGEDEELDSVLRTRNSTKWALLTEYELIDDAVINICLDATLGVTGVIVDSQNPRGAGTFDVYMAGELVTASAGDITLAQAAIDARVFGSTSTPKTAIVYGAAATPLNFTGTVYFKGTYTAAQMQTATDLAIEEYVKQIPLGGYDFYPGPSNVVPINDVEAVLRAVQISGQDVQKTVVLNSPADLSVSTFGKVTVGTITLIYTPIV